MQAVVLEECSKLHRIEQTHNEIVFLQGKVKLDLITEDQERRLEVLIEANNRAWEHIITYDRLQLLPRKIEDDIFFEKLISYTNKAALSFQRSEKISEKFEQNELLNRLRILKKSYSFNAEQIRDIELRLSEIEEKINRERVDNYFKLDILNNEKITPHFLRIAKTINNDSLEIIGQPNGERFEHASDREAHIVDFYTDLYSLPETMPQDFAGCIENFLGEYICGHEVVQNSKLSEQEKNLLENALSITELDESIKTLNLKSAPGIDGVSNKFIAKFWRFFREPLHRYATLCVEKGRLTSTFNTAIIRLIPKRGDKTLLKNWRPTV